MNDTYNIRLTKTETGFTATVKELEIVTQGATWQEALHAVEQAIVSRLYQTTLIAKTSPGQQVSHL